MRRACASGALAAASIVLGACGTSRSATTTTASTPPTGAARDADSARLAGIAARVTITRDDWGIPHIHGPTDADAVFGMMYAQGEDDFPADLRALMDAWADGLNWFLRTNPQVTPRAITRFEPWMALSFTEGSIGGDIEGVSLGGIRAFYETPPAPPAGGGRAGAARTREAFREDGTMSTAIRSHDDARRDALLDSVPGGSNGIALAPSRTASGRALLLINPHTSHYFRSEAQVRSDAGLDVYGASTWGQFFVYQGFNARLGWMHTSAYPDVVDEYAETVELRDGVPHYRYGTTWRPMTARTVTLRVRTAAGLVPRTITTWHTHHGPITRREGDRWIATRLMDTPIAALRQSYGRTKARTLAEFRAVMALQANSSNATVYADADGNIAYFHPNFVPVRDTAFDWDRPVDGSDPATEWRGVHPPAELPNTINPRGGFIQNTNNWPYTAAGPSESPRSRDFPRYMDRAGENPRGIHALRVIGDRRDFTAATLRDAAYDPDVTAFEPLLPLLVRAYDALPAGDARRTRLAEPVAVLRAWDRRWSTTSEATTLAIFWGEELWRRSAPGAGAARLSPYEWMATRLTDAQRIDALAVAVDTLTGRFGTWRRPWGEVNRFQRLANAITPTFDDAQPSEAVGFTSARWGSLASFDARRTTSTRRIYGTYGNSFVAVVEFGPRVRAQAIMAGGQSGDSTSRHFRDQASRYARGALRDVYLTDADLAGHVERSYR
ncbi:MAG: penicillin acylase family protein, partial [Gemmatimonadaceae bacterium]|nr:penicillin acylase family protein [Gemmatimonadaceae bacterium]